VDIYDEIISNYLTNVIRQPNFAVVGIAGIGKSGFFLYFLLRYMEHNRILHINRGNKSFFLSNVQKSVTFFNHVDGFRLKSTTLDFLKYAKLLKKKYPLFVDMETEDYPFNNNGLLIISISCKPGRFKERTKNGFNKLMPTWSYEEMSLLSCLILLVEIMRKIW
jgi:hypothetical protein